MKNRKNETPVVETPVTVETVVTPEPEVETGVLRDITGRKIEMGPRETPLYTPRSTFALTEKGKKVGEKRTKQVGIMSGKVKYEAGQHWTHQSCEHTKVGRSTRRQVVDQLETLGEVFSHQQVMDTLGSAPLGKAVLGSGTPTSYLKAFLREGLMRIVELEPAPAQETEA